jgi:hypothetical protein
MLQDFPVMFQRLQLTYGNSTRHARDMEPKSPLIEGGPQKAAAVPTGIAAAETTPAITSVLPWMVALRRAEKRGDDLQLLIDLLLRAEKETAPPRALRLLGKLLQQHRLTRLPRRPYSVFHEPKKQRMLDAVQLVRDMRKGVTGSLEDLKRQLQLSPGETRFTPIDNGLPPPRKLTRDEAIREVANLKGIDRAELGNAVDGRASYLRR